MTEFRTDEAFACALDTDDPMAGYRRRFLFPHRTDGTECIYFCGNSLGLQPAAARAMVEQELEDWARLGVEGHFHAKRPWLPYHEFLTEQTARLVGAQPSEVVNMNSLTVNLHLMMVTFYRPTRERRKILIEPGAFPSDRYAVESQIRFHGFDPADALLIPVPRSGEATMRTEDIEALIAREGSSIALILFGGVNYYTGQAFDMERIARAGHARGCSVGFDLAHAAGNLVLRLHEWDVDFAVWCSYKYLNAGPGAIAGCFVHDRHVRRTDLPRFAGWWGHNKETRFFMPDVFTAIPTAEGWQLSNPPIFQLAALKASLDVFDDAGMEKLRAKSERLTAYLEYLLDELGGRIRCLTPRDPKQRGCQLSLVVPRNGRVVHQALTGQGVVCDWREPDVIRVAPVPLYNSFLDVYRFVQILKSYV
jgi:kynureninase